MIYSRWLVSVLSSLALSASAIAQDKIAAPPKGPIPPPLG